MQHLSLETLARLIDEPANGDEAAHLDGCATCRRELDELRAQTAALAALPPWQAPARGWPVLEARLAHERLLRAPPAAAARRWGGPRLLRAAAYFGLFLLGGASGLAVSGARGAAGGVGGPTAGTGGTGGEPALTADVRTPEAAARRLQEAESLYLEALAQFNELRGLPRGDADPAARLAALESIVLTTRAALEAAPADPMLNGYFLSAIGQRDAVLRQIALPAEDPWF